MMLTKLFVLTASCGLLTGAALLAPSADNPKELPNYQPVAEWPRLPEGAKFGAVTAVATDAADRVYVFHRGKSPIMVFAADGKLLRSWGDDVVKTAHGLRIDPAANVWITDIGNHLVTQFDAEGKVLRTLGTKDKPGQAADQFNKPTDVAVAPSGEFYIADGYGNSRVVKFSRDGKYLKEWGKKGAGEGEFNLPHAIALDATGRVLVGDRENNRVQVFDADGKFITQWKDSGAPYGFSPAANDRWLVADGRANNVRVLDKDGNVLGRFGAKGTNTGEFGMPHWICMDRRGAIYVAEVNGQRIQKFVAR